MYSTKEQQLRRKLARLGYGLHKDRRYRYIDGYMIIMLRYNVIAAGGDFPLTLEEVEEWTREAIAEQEELSL